MGAAGDAGPGAPADAVVPADGARVLSAEDLLGGSALVHEVEVPGDTLAPGGAGTGGRAGVVRLRPLSIAALAAISRAARDDPGLVPVLMLKEALVEPSLQVGDIRRMHVGLVQLLLDRVNVISGIASDGAAEDALASPLGETHLLLATHFGWTPEQVSQLTPGQVAVYLAGVQRLLELERQETAAP